LMPVQARSTPKVNPIDLNLSQSSEERMPEHLFGARFVLFRLWLALWAGIFTDNFPAGRSRVTKSPRPSKPRLPRPRRERGGQARTESSARRSRSTPGWSEFSGTTPISQGLGLARTGPVRSADAIRPAQLGRAVMVHLQESCSRRFRDLVEKRRRLNPA
jgi:hypothetical protein